MNLKVEGVWCKTRTEFDKLSKKDNYDLTISYFDVFNRLVKSDPFNSEPSGTIVTLYIRKMIQKVLSAIEEEDLETAEIKILYMFKNLNSETIVNFRDFVNELANTKCDLDLIIINRCDYPKKGVLSKFDNVRFIDND
jgi:hypothetical protein